LLVLVGPQVAHWLTTPFDCVFHGRTKCTQHPVCVRPLCTSITWNHSQMMK
jgi:hypothetical protein